MYVFEPKQPKAPNYANTAWLSGAPGARGAIPAAGAPVYKADGEPENAAPPPMLTTSTELAQRGAAGGAVSGHDPSGQSEPVVTVVPALPPPNPLAQVLAPVREAIDGANTVNLGTVAFALATLWFLSMLTSERES